MEGAGGPDMDYHLSRHSSVLWNFVQELQGEADNKQFFDLTIYCSDGSLPWNRLCLALSVPSCAVLLDHGGPRWTEETDVTVSLADVTVDELRTMLESCLPGSAITIHPSLIPGGGKVAFDLVEREVEEPLVNGHIDSEEEETPEKENVKNKKKKIKRKSTDQPKPASLKKKTDQLFSDSDDSDDPGPVDLPDHSDGQSDISCNENEQTEAPKKNAVRPEKPAAFDSDEWDDFCAGEALGGSDLGDGDSEEVDSDSESQKVQRKKGKHTKYDSDSSNSDSDSKSENESLQKRLSKKKKKQQSKVRRSYSQDDSSESESEEERHPMVKINAAEIKMEPDEQRSPKKTSRPKKKERERKKKPVGRAAAKARLREERERKKRKVLRNYTHETNDYDAALDAALRDSDESEEPEKEIDYAKLATSKKLFLDCGITMMNYKLTEDELDDRRKILRKTRNVVKKEAEPSLPEVKMEVVEEERILVDMASGGVEEECVQPHITKYMVGDKVIKQCNTCDFSTDRKDKITIREHLFKHFPDICGFACPVCRKTAKRKRELILHMERTHTAEQLLLFGIEYMKQFEVSFDTNSEEQVNLRAEEYCQLGACTTCKEIFYSAERVKFHVDIGMCVFREEKLKVLLPKVIYKGDDFDWERKRLDNVMDSSSSDDNSSAYRRKKRKNSSEDEDFHPGEYYANAPGVISFEQLPIYANMEGLMTSLKGSAPFRCVVPSCNNKQYPTRTAIKRHYIAHDPEMYSTLICPIESCTFTKPEDQPGPMIKHIIQDHDKDREWARENISVSVSERLKQFREATGMFNQRQGSGLLKERRGGWSRSGEKRKNNVKVKKCPISIEDPEIIASFEKGGGHSESGSRWPCAVEDCDESFRLAYELKRHYVKHDVTLSAKILECDSCNFSTHLHRLMNTHLEEEHMDQAFLAETGDGAETYTVVAGKRWEEFNKVANILIEKNPNHNGREWEARDTAAVFQTISVTCQTCSEEFNTQNSFEDHEKVHKPEMIKFNCEQCQEGFIVESVYKNHVKSHQILYTSLKAGPIRCNGCSQHFQRVVDVKKHMTTHHMNLLENCHFCEQCTEFFTFKHSLRNHMFVHADKVFRCPICPQKFLSQEEADVHIERKKCKAKSLNHVCTHCGRRFASPKLMEVHIKKVHENILQYQCNICHQLFENTHLIERHIGKSHGIEGPNVMEHYTFHSLEAAKLLDTDRLNANKPKGRRGMRSEEKYPCPFGCGGTFKRSGLTRHKKVCSRSTEDFQVEVANAEDVDRKVAEIMEPIMDPVSGKSVWKCMKCDYQNKLRFTVKDHCEIHLNLAHKCPHCERTCPTRNALRAHIFRNHDDKKRNGEDDDMEPLPIEAVAHIKVPEAQQKEEVNQARAWLDELAAKQLTNNLLAIENSMEENGEIDNGQEYPMSLTKDVKPRLNTLLPKSQKEEYLIQHQLPPKKQYNTTMAHKPDPENQASREAREWLLQQEGQPLGTPSMSISDQVRQINARLDMEITPKPAKSQHRTTHHQQPAPKTHHQQPVQKTHHQQSIPKFKPPREAPRETPRQQEQQMVPPNAHMGQINQGLLNHPMLNHPLMNPIGAMSPMRNYFDDNISQNSEDNNITFTEPDNRQQQPPVANQPPTTNAQNPYGLPGYNFPIWPFYQR